MSNRPRRPNSRAGGKVPFIALDQSSGQPLYDQVYAAVRAHILSGRLARGAKLASSRELAIELGISRFTVVTAFDALIAEGYLMTAQRGGTFVAQVLPDLALRAKSSRVPRGKPTTSRAVTEHRAEDLSARGRSIAAITITGPRSPADEPRPFHPRRAPVDLFPVALWSRLVRRQWRARRHQMLEYGEPGGLPGLREAIAQHASSTRGVACTPDQVIVTSGAQQAFNLIFHLLLNPGDAAWLEEPGYLDARGALAASGARIVPVPVDREGIVVEAGIAAAADARLAYVSPSHQYPTGASMSASRRLELLAWAHRAHAWIVEDDYDSYFRYRGRPLPALQRLEADQLEHGGSNAIGNRPRVIYVGTFSKTMFPSLRLGYCIVPTSLAPAFANARAIADRNSSLTDQAALELFIREGHYDRHLRRVRSACFERHEAILESIDRHLGGALMAAPMNAGTHVVALVAPGLPSPTRIEQMARDEGLVVFPLSRYCLIRPARNALILGYGGLTPRAIDTGASRLARLLNTAGDDSRAKVRARRF
jgi:GntR family transcriptional regulator/MocR family aminotransferase